MVVKDNQLCLTNFAFQKYLTRPENNLEEVMAIQLDC